MQNEKLFKTLELIERIYKVDRYKGTIEISGTVLPEIQNELNYLKSLGYKIRRQYEKKTS